MKRCIQFMSAPPKCRKHKSERGEGRISINTVQFMNMKLQLDFQNRQAVVAIFVEKDRSTTQNRKSRPENHNKQDLPGIILETWYVNCYVINLLLITLYIFYFSIEFVKGMTQSHINFTIISSIIQRECLFLLSTTNFTNLYQILLHLSRRYVYTKISLAHPFSSGIIFACLLSNCST